MLVSRRPCPVNLYSVAESQLWSAWALALQRSPSCFWVGAAIGKGQMGSALMGSLQISCFWQRDFLGIPIVVASQALTDAQLSQLGSELGKGWYEAFFSRSWKELRNYMNDQWIFVDTHKMMQAYPIDNTGMHLGSSGQKLVAKFIAENIEPTLIKASAIHCR